MGGAGTQTGQVTSSHGDSCDESEGASQLTKRTVAGHRSVPHVDKVDLVLLRKLVVKELEGLAVQRAADDLAYVEQVYNDDLPRCQLKKDPIVKWLALWKGKKAYTTASSSILDPETGYLAVDRERASVVLANERQPVYDEVAANFEVLDKFLKDNGLSLPEVEWRIAFEEFLDIISKPRHGSPVQDGILCIFHTFYPDGPAVLYRIC